MGRITDTLIGKSATVTIGEVTVDASISEGHYVSADVSDHPVERGSDITDHVRKRNPSLSIEAIITNTPLGTSYPLQTAIGSATAAANDDDPVLNAWNEIRRYFDESVLVDIVTSLHVYKSMALTEFNVQRDAENGREVLHFTVQAQELRIVSTETMEALQLKEAEPETTTVEQEKADKGNQPTEDANDSEAASVEYKALRAVGVF